VGGKHQKMKKNIRTKEEEKEKNPKDALIFKLWLDGE
jgi:hypothetical protein